MTVLPLDQALRESGRAASPAAVPGRVGLALLPAPAQRAGSDDRVSVTPAGPGAWAATVSTSDEACLLLDAVGCVAALSGKAATLLDLHPDVATGVRLQDLLTFVDFSLEALSTPEAAQDSPPLRALSTGGMARGLVRRRRASGALTTYDVVAVPLAGGAGVLAFVVAL